MSGYNFSKLLLFWLMMVAHTILGYAMVVMWKLRDVSALPVLISVVGLEVIAGVIWYMKKAAAENVEKIKKGDESFEDY